MKNKADESENEKLACLKNHNQNLLTQIKNIKNDKKSLENKLEPKSPDTWTRDTEDTEIQVSDTGTTTPGNMTRRTRYIYIYIKKIYKKNKNKK
jgi:hypothetical protein